MHSSLLATTALLVLASASPAQQRDSAAFIIRLGNDTVAVERHVRTGDRITMEAVQRSPSTMRHRLEMNLGRQGRVTGGEWIAFAPGQEPAVRRTYQVQGDSVIVTTVQGSTTRTVHVAARDPIMLAGPFYTPYELAIRRAVAGGDTSVPLLAATSVVRIPIGRVGRDSVTLQNQFGEPMRAHVDPQGRLLHLHTPAFTTVERIAWADLDSLTAHFVTRDRTGQGMGSLSPRLAYRTTIGAANIWIDYSRPAMRGRPVWGALVPFGEVWRLGANDATHLATDRTIELGPLTLAPGTYTLFLLPTPDQWTLIVNRGTGMSGLARDPALDVGRVPLTLEMLERPAEQFTIELSGTRDGGQLAVSWDRMRGTTPVRAVNAGR